MADVIEIMEGTLLVNLPSGTSKDEVKIKYFSKPKVMTYAEHVADWKKRQKAKPKKDLTPA